MTALGLLLVCKHAIPEAHPSLTLDGDAPRMRLNLCYRDDPPESRFMSIGIDDVDWDRGADDVVAEIVAHEKARRAKPATGEPA